jgi:elongation factor P
MNPETYDQVSIPARVIGEQVRFLQPDMRLPVEFVEDQPVSVIFPEILELRITATAPPTHAQQDNTWKPARLENDVEIMVPQFIKSGDLVRLDVESLKYVDRAKDAGRAMRAGSSKAGPNEPRS